MSLLPALIRAYDHLVADGEVPPYGYSSEKISFVISLGDDGNPVGSPIDLRQQIGRKLVAPPMFVPRAVKRTSGIAPNFLWDKTSYVLGISGGEGKRLAEEHSAFEVFHQQALEACDDLGLSALLGFLRNWRPERFSELSWPTDIADLNVVFALESERRQRYLHDRPAARQLWERLSSEGVGAEAICLATGLKAPVARLHPSIKGVWGGQSSGVSLVSFNKEAFESYGHQQGDNAQISEAAAFAYGAVLNRFLATGSPNRIQIGDASTVFWAEASDPAASRLAENAFLAMLDKVDETKQAAEVGAILEKMRAGQPVHDFSPQLAEGVRFYVLGLAPNAARVSVRFWLEDSFGAFAERYGRYMEEIRIEPPPRDPHPGLWKMLLELAVLGKRENLPPNLAGECLRAILGGTPYPATLLSTLLMRLRADRTVSALRIALLKAILIRNLGYKEVPMSLDPDNRDTGYLLGRLFALYEHVQVAALGRNVNATIKDKFYGAASAQPRKVFHLLDSGSVNHLAKVGKTKAGLRVVLERDIGAVMDLMSPAADPFPAFLSAAQQALFGLGYYHQRNEFFRGKAADIFVQKDESP